MKKIILTVFIIMFSAFQTYAIDYNVYNLDNGQTVIIKQVKNNPIVTIDTWVKTGSINENDRNNGVSHFLEHLFFKGSANLLPGEFDKTLEAKGAVTNAATSKDFTHYYIEIPSKHFETALKLHADMLLNPVIPKKELEKERKVVMEEIAKDENNPDEKVYENLIEMLYTTHPYKRKVIGTNEIISKITRDEILDYYNTHYSPQNMVTIIIGDVEPNAVLEQVKKEFNIKPRKITYNINKPEKPLVKQISKIDYQPVTGGYMMIGYRGADILNPDTYALDVLSTILGDGRSSILYQVLKEQKQLAISIDAGNATYKEDGIFEISANFQPENADKVKASVFEEIDKIRKFGVSESQLQLAKNLIERNTYYSRESNSNVATQLGYTTILSGNTEYSDKYLENIKNVKINDVKRVAIKYLAPNKAAISIVLPKNCEQKQSVKQDIKQHQAKVIQEKDNTKKYEIDNGTTLLITQNKFNDIVAISIYSKGGSLSEKIAGTGDLTASLMLKGTKKYSALEFAKQMEINGIKIVPKVTSDNFEVNIMTTKNQLAKAFELLNEVINNAAFEEKEIEKIKAQKLNAIKQSRDIPLNIALEEYKSMIFENSPYSYGSKIYEKTIPMITRNDITEYYKNAFYPKNTIITINGNVTQEEVLNNIANIFDGKTGNVFNYNDYADKIHPVKAKKSEKSIKDLKTSWLVMGWQTAGVLNEKESAALQVLDSILGTGMSSRLFKNLRDAEGLAYQIGSSYSPKVLKGAFSIYIGTNPENLKSVQEKMLFEVKRFKYELVSDKELQEAKDKILGKFLLSQETNLDKASYYSWFEASGRGFEFKDKYIELINSVTASDITDVANKYFNDNFVVSVVKELK